MTDPAAPPVASDPDRRRYILLGTVVGALQPLLLATIAVWMKAEITLDTSNPFVSGARLGWPFSIPCALIGGGSSAFIHSAYLRFGRDALLPILFTYIFMTTGTLLFLFLTPA